MMRKRQMRNSLARLAGLKYENEAARRKLSNIHPADRVHARETRKDCVHSVTARFECEDEEEESFEAKKHFAGLMKEPKGPSELKLVTVGRAKRERKNVN